ncbi:hypothetical protein SDC9_115810 [bioreactor metagenome]|uniref:Uncharacterized protein n=1 Tax=bioreactor metagenome TaxID=1076179 RepID=A0A645BUE4_9ZZZZ
MIRNTDQVMTRTDDIGKEQAEYNAKYHGRHGAKVNGDFFQMLLKEKQRPVH